MVDPSGIYHIEGPSEIYTQTAEVQLAVSGAQHLFNLGLPLFALSLVDFLSFLLFHGTDLKILFLFLSKVSFEKHIQNLKKISCWFKIWMGFVGPILIKLWKSSIWGFFLFACVMASWDLLMQTCWWPLSDYWSVQLTSHHLSGFVGVGGAVRFLVVGTIGQGKDHHGVSSGWSIVWHRSNTGQSSTQYKQIPIILGVWPFWLTPFFVRSITFWRAYG